MFVLRSLVNKKVLQPPATICSSWLIWHHSHRLFDSYWLSKFKYSKLNPLIAFLLTSCPPAVVVLFSLCNQSKVPKIREPRALHLPLFPYQRTWERRAYSQRRENGVVSGCDVGWWRGGEVRCYGATSAKEIRIRYSYFVVVVFLAFPLRSFILLHLLFYI